VKVALMTMEGPDIGFTTIIGGGAIVVQCKEACPRRTTCTTALWNTSLPEPAVPPSNAAK